MIIIENKKGMTIVEMIVSISIFVIGITGFTLLFVNTWRNNSYTLEMGQSSMAVSQGLNKMVGYIRSAKQSDNGSYPIASGKNNDLILYSDYDGDGKTEKLHFYLSNQIVYMGVTEPSSTMPISYPSTDQTTTVVASHIVNPESNPIFFYYNNNYPGDTVHNPLATPIDVSSARLIKIHLMINIIPERAPDNIEMQSFAELRNLNDYNSSE